MIPPREENENAGDHADADDHQTFLGSGKRTFHRIFPLISKLAEPSAPIIGWIMLQL